MKIGMAIFAFTGGHDLTTKMSTHQLHAVADPQHRDAQFKKLLSNLWRTLFIDRFRTTGKDNPAGFKGLNLLKPHIKRMQLTVDMSLSHPPGDQLGVLRTEIEDQNLFFMDI